MVTKVAANGGFAVEAAHSKKVKKYRERCEREGLVFLPLAVDTLGGWHKEAQTHHFFSRPSTLS